MTQQQYYQRKVKEVLQAVLSVVVPGQEETMWSCLREDQQVRNVGKEPPAKRKRLELVLWKHLSLLITTPKTGKLKSRFFLSLLMISVRRIFKK